MNRTTWSTNGTKFFIGTEYMMYSCKWHSRLDLQIVLLPDRRRTYFKDYSSRRIYDLFQVSTIEAIFRKSKITEWRHQAHPYKGGYHLLPSLLLRILESLSDGCFYQERLRFSTRQASRVFPYHENTHPARWTPCGYPLYWEKLRLSRNGVTRCLRRGYEIAG